jgi:hypothetical protein
MAPAFLSTRRRHIVLAVAIAFMTPWLWSGPGAAQTSLEYEVKAAFLYKFAGFVNWPAPMNAMPALGLCVVGEDPFGPLLDEVVRGQTIAGRPIEVRRFATAQPGIPCHVAYLSGSPAQSVQGAISALRGQPVLLVTDEGRSPAQKGIIHLLVRQNRLRFEIDDGLAAENHLTLSSKLLSLATTVKGRP